MHYFYSVQLPTALMLCSIYKDFLIQGYIKLLLIHFKNNMTEKLKQYKWCVKGILSNIVTNDFWLVSIMFLKQTMYFLYAEKCFYTELAWWFGGYYSVGQACTCA